MPSKVVSSLVTTTAAVTLAAAPAAAEQAAQLSNLNGGTAASVETALDARGFKYIASNTNTMGYTYSYWWDGDDKNCVRVEARNGSVESIVDATKSDCNHSGDGNTAAAVGVVAGAAILGALLLHKSDHHDDRQHYSNSQDEAQYDRGFRDGLYSASYHNSDRSNAYSSGYQAGVDQRTANLRTHSGRGGYVATAQFSDLQGARAAGAMDALNDRGFRQVDNFTSGNTRYSIRWRQASRQCIQVTVADGHVYDIRDIGTNPHCH